MALDGVVLKASDPAFGDKLGGKVVIEFFDQKGDVFLHDMCRHKWNVKG